MAKATTPNYAAKLKAAILNAAITGKLTGGTDGWKTVKLDELGKFQGGHTPSKLDKTLWGGDILWVSSKDMKAKYIEDTGDKITEKGAKELGLLPPRTILMCTRSGILRRTFPVAIARKHLTINQDQKALILTNPQMAEWVYLVLKGFESYILLTYRKSGTTVESIIWNEFVKMEIPLPPLPVQKEIVKKVEELLRLVDIVQEGERTLAELGSKARAKILDLAIHGKLVPQDPNDEPVSVSSTSDKPPYQIPPNWRWVKGEKLFSDTETKLPNGEYFDYIDIDAIDNKQHCITAPKHLLSVHAPSRASRGLQAGDTLFSLVRPYLQNIAFVEDKFKDCIASTGFFVCRSRVCDPKFLYWMMLSPYVVNGLTSFMKGDNSPSIRKGNLHEFNYPLPPLAEQRRIVAKVEELLRSVDILTK